MQSCKDCTRRYVGCHERCTAYKDYKAVLDKKKGRASTEYQEYTSEVLYKRGKAVTR